MEGKTVSELAKELNVSVQTIYKRLNRFKTTFKDSAGRKIVTKEQEDQIKSDLKKPREHTHTNQAIDTLIDQLKSKDETIKELSNLLNQEQILHKHTQQQLENTRKKLEFKESKENTPPESWWGKLVKRFKL